MKGSEEVASTACGGRKLGESEGRTSRAEGTEESMDAVGQAGDAAPSSWRLLGGLHRAESRGVGTSRAVLSGCSSCAEPHTAVSPGCTPLPRNPGEIGPHEFEGSATTAWACGCSNPVWFVIKSFLWMEVQNLTWPVYFGHLPGSTRSACHYLHCTDEETEGQK